MEQLRRLGTARPAELEYMSMPELIVGRDGRWHIVYKNYLTDQIMCRSTR